MTNDADIRLSIVFLNYNKLGETQTTIEQLKIVCKHRNDVEVIAVDNASNDGTKEYLSQQSLAKTIFLDENTGIAGYNKGFSIAQGEYILVLDDDSAPMTYDALEKAMDYLDRHPQTGLVACHIQSPDGSQQWSWHLPKQLEETASPMFIGCGFIIRNQLFRDIGGYPADFFLYQNEVDVAFKVYQMNYDIIYLPDCVIEHRGIPALRPGWRRIYYPTRNTLWLIRKYYPQPIAAYMIFSRIIIGFVRAIQFRLLSDYWRAVKDGLQTKQSTTTLDAAIRKKAYVFFKQNSLFHQLFRLN